MNFADKIDYDQLVKKHPWVIERDKQCIVSPDSDGLLCGLFMSHFLNWKVVGFYDAKALLMKKGTDLNEAVFLDVEIFRNNIKSIGQHMVMFNKDNLPENWNNFDNCISPNNLRNYDFKNNFQQKYPLATIHFLISILGKYQKIDIAKAGIPILLYTDGTFKNLFNYPDNSLSWLKFVGIDDKDSAIRDIFYHDYSMVELMSALKEIFEELRNINDGKRGGDKIQISNSGGNVVNFDFQKSALEENVRNKATSFLKLLSSKTGWKYNDDYWPWGTLIAAEFKKASTLPTKKRYFDLMKKKPLSFAITSSLAIEHTLDSNKVFK